MARVGVPSSFQGGADVFHYVRVGSKNTKGYQITVDGIDDLSNANVSVKPFGTDVWKSVSLQTGSGNSVVVADGFKITEIRIEIPTSGAYTITVYGL